MYICIHLYSGGMYRTVDAGNSWKTENTAEAGQAVFSMKIFSTDVGIAGDAFGKCYADLFWAVLLFFLVYHSFVTITFANETLS